MGHLKEKPTYKQILLKYNNSIVAAEITFLRYVAGFSWQK